MSAHPDDLVFSAFSALLDRSSSKIGLIFFNVSSSTRWGPVPRGWLNLPQLAISGLRILEDKFALGNLGVKSVHFHNADSKASKRYEMKMNAVRIFPFPQLPARVYTPLGLGGHPDHISVRNVAVYLWRNFQKRPRLIFYEDLPYAFLLQNRGQEERKCFEELERELGKNLQTEYSPLAPKELARKLRYMRLYFSQMNSSSLSQFAQYARLVGRECGMEYAERFVSVASR